MKPRALISLLLMTSAVAVLGTISGSAHATAGGGVAKLAAKDIAYPNAPADLRITDSSQQTSLAAAWSAVSGASGYRIGRNGVALTDTSRTSYLWAGLACGTTYTLSVQPETSTKDTSGRVATVSGRTASCNPSVGGSTRSSASSRAYPDAPSDLRLTGATQTSLTASWSGVLGASGYRVGRNGLALADTAQAGYTWTGLVCGTTYSLSVQPETSTKDTSGRVATITDTTSACGRSGNETSSAGQASPEQTPPFTLSTSIANGAIVSRSVTWTANSQGTSVARVEFVVDGVLRWTEHLAPYQFNGDPGGVLDTTTLRDGAHVLSVVAYATDGRTASVQVAITVANAALGTAGNGTTTSIAFEANFDSNDISRWQSTPLGGAQCLNYRVNSDSGITRGNFYASSDASAKGHSSGRFDLPAASVNNACELLRGRTVAMDDEWYAMEVKFPSGWSEPSPAEWGMSLAQFNFENIWGSPLSLTAHSNYVDVNLNSGMCTSFTARNPSCQYSSGIQGNVPRQHILPSSAFSVAAWHQFLIHVRWTNSNDGIVEGFHRTRGQTTWTETASLRGYPTLQRTSSFTPSANDRTVDKIGAYRGAASFPVSIWLDNFCQATSRSAAETCF